MSRISVRLPEKSFCGIGFGHRRWFRHLGDCGKCREGWNEYKDNESSRLLDSWDVRCSCGCGRLAAYGKKFYRGHSVLTEEERERRSSRMFDQNPMWTKEAQVKLSDFWSGRSRPEQCGEMNSAKRADVRQKISDRNPMRVERFRVSQREGCLTAEEVVRRAAQMRDHNPSKDRMVLAKRIDTYTRRLANGEYHLRNNWKTGWHVLPDGSREWYDSSYELDQMRQYDLEGIHWTKRHGIRIPYVSSSGIQTYYVPDFLVSENGRKSLVEVKGWMSPQVKVKALVAMEYCRQKGMRYILLMGKKREVCLEFSFTGNEECRVA